MISNSSVDSNLLEIANLALVYLNLTPNPLVRDVTEYKMSNDKYLKILSSLLQTSVEMVLEEFPWKFAITSSFMVKDATGGYMYPADCIRLVGVGEEHEDCLCALAVGFTTGSSTVIATDNNLTTAISNNLNRSNKYLENVAFTIVDGRYFFKVSHARYPCCNDYKKLYYIHNRVDEMKMPAKFKDLCAKRIVMNMVSGTKSDPSYALKAQDSKQYFFDLRNLIEQEYEQFKYFVTGKAEVNRSDIRGTRIYGGFQISPYDKRGW